MAIKDYEFYHGAVLAKILRKEVPTNLKLIETNTKESWSTYKINDSFFLYMKYSAAPRLNQNGVRWNFTFTPNHLKELQKLLSEEVFFVLICVVDDRDEHFKDYRSEICLLNCQQVKKLIDVNANVQQQITVYSEKNKSLKAHGTMSAKRKELTIDRNEIDNLNLPA